MPFTFSDVQDCCARGEFRPRLLVGEEYNDNITLADDHQQDDFITTVEPGVAGTWDAKFLLVDYDTALRFRKYADFSENDETQLRDILRGRAKAELFRERRFSVSVLDEYERVAIDPRDPVVAESDLVNMTNRNRLVVVPEYRFPFQTWSATVRYQYEKLSYDHSAGDDSDAHLVGLDLAKQLSSTHDCFLRAAGEDRHVRGRQDFRRGDLSAGLSWKPSSRFSLIGSGGLAWIDFTENSDPFSSPEEEAVKDRRTSSWDLQGLWMIRPNLTASILYMEMIDLSVDEGAFESRKAEAFLQYARRSSAKLRFYVLDDDYLDSNRRDRSANASLEFSFPLDKVWTLGLNGNVERATFDPEDERLWRYRGTIVFNYAHRRFGAGGGYTVNVQDSDLDGNDFTNNVVYVHGGVSF